MSTKLKSMVFALALSGLVGGTLVVTSDEARAGSTHYQAENMFVFGNPAGLVAGAATLTQTKKDISFRVYTSGLEPGANTAWIAIFNKPQNCAGGPGACVAPDLANPAVRGSTVYGAGSIVGPDGIGSFYGSLKEGSPPDGIEVNTAGGTVNGLKNSMKAEIHLVVRKHGAIDDPGGAVTQLTTFESPASCIGGAGACANVQAAVFEAVE